MDNVEQLLRSLPLFSAFSDESMKQLLANITIKTFPAGESMIQVGQPGRFLGIVLEGEAEVVESVQFGQRRAIRRIKSGGYFGEMSLMTGEPTCADVIAHEECRIALIPADFFSRTIVTNPNAVRHLAKVISYRLRVREEDPEERELIRDAWRHAIDPYGLKLGTGSRPMKILILKCNGDFIRYSYSDTEYEANNLEGTIGGIGTDAALNKYSSSWGEFEEPSQVQDYSAALNVIRETLTQPEIGFLKSMNELAAVGHIVTWGGEFERSVLINDDVIGQIKSNLTLAPPQSKDDLAVIEQMRQVLPGVPQIAVFETSYHRTIPPYAYLYGIPYEFYQTDKLRRYGSHGLVHNYAALMAATYLKQPFRELKLATCYLDETASVCAIDHGRSIDTSTGLTSLEGLTTQSGCGNIDPAIILYLIEEKKLSPPEVEQILSKGSGLSGISGKDNFEEIESAAEQGDQRAILASHMFCYRTKKYIGAYAASLGGLDALVFTGGIAGTKAGVRARICQGLSYMGVTLDDMKNRDPAFDSDGIAEISDEDSRVKILIVPADEFRVATAETRGVLERENIAAAIRDLPQIPIPIGVSAHHIHLSKDDLEALFGEGYELTPRLYLSQPGQYACEESVSLIGPKGRIERVRVLGPLREETQVEIARTEQFRLGIDAPIRASGYLGGSPGITIEGPKGTVDILEGVICSTRHIHMSPEDALRFGLRDKDVVMVQVEGERPLIFGDVLVRIKSTFQLDMHIDTDESNAAGITTGMVGYLREIQARS